MKKIDTRQLHPEGRNEIRRMVIRLRQQSGMSCAELAQIAGIHEMTVRKWLRRAEQEGVGSLTEKPRGRPVGSCRKITLAQEQWLREQIVGFNPKQLVLPFALWTRRAIKALILKAFGLEMSDRLIGKYLKRWGFTPQRPIKRALEQRPGKLLSGSRKPIRPLRPRPELKGRRSILGMKRRSRRILSGFGVMPQKVRRLFSKNPTDGISSR